MNTIQETWVGYSRAVINKEASAEQRRIMKHAYYSGANNTLQLMWQLGDARTDEDKAVEILDIYNKEVEEFFTNIHPEDSKLSGSSKEGVVYATWCEYLILNGMVGLDPGPEHDIKASYYAGIHSVLNLSMNEFVDMSLDAGAMIIQGLSEEVSMYFKEDHERKQPKSTKPKRKKRPKRH